MLLGRMYVLHVPLQKELYKYYLEVLASFIYNVLNHTLSKPCYYQYEPYSLWYIIQDRLSRDETVPYVSAQ